MLKITFYLKHNNVVNVTSWRIHCSKKLLHYTHKAVNILFVFEVNKHIYNIMASKAKVKAVWPWHWGQGQSLNNRYITKWRLYINWLLVKIYGLVSYIYFECFYVKVIYFIFNDCSQSKVKQNVMVIAWKLMCCPYWQ